MPRGGVLRWDDRVRPRPDNVKLYSTVSQAVAEQSWDWVLAHNVSDLIDSRVVPVPKVFLVHGTLSGRVLQDGARVDHHQYVSSLSSLLDYHGCKVVYISELKQRDWAMPGCVISSAVDPSWYGGHLGNVRGVLQVCNHLVERGGLLGYEVRRDACLGLPTKVVGKNPGLGDAVMANDWDALKDYYRAYRVYLHSSIFPHEDGYNLAMLEAMASGMPIATLTHPTSPIEDGVDGIVASTSTQLRARIVQLLDRPDQALEMGRAALEKVKRAFPVKRFRHCWQSLAAELVHEPHVVGS